MSQLAGNDTLPRGQDSSVIGTRRQTTTYSMGNGGPSISDKVETRGFFSNQTTSTTASTDRANATIFNKSEFDGTTEDTSSATQASSGPGGADIGSYTWADGVIEDVSWTSKLTSGQKEASLDRFEVNTSLLGSTHTSSEASANPDGTRRVTSGKFNDGVICDTSLMSAVSTGPAGSSVEAGSIETGLFTKTSRAEQTAGIGNRSILSSTTDTESSVFGSNKGARTGTVIRDVDITLTKEGYATDDTTSLRFRRDGGSDAAK